LSCTGALAWAAAARADAAGDLGQLSIEELGNIQVTSVSKRAEAVGQAPSSIYVITSEAIAASGALTLPEILRLAPNLQVAQTSSSRYVITARGFNGAPAAQSFSNKLLILIDGRSVYTPLFSGVYWDMQDVLPQDIERIEVISGPGATLWGANAVNGVVNIITRNAGETKGGLVSLAGGEWEGSASLRYGGDLSPTISYRAYVRSYWARDTDTAGGASANDHWSRPRAGFRLDWAASPHDGVSLTANAYDGDEAQAGAPAEGIRGRNIVGRWTRTLSADSTLQVQAYYDLAQRSQEVDGSGFRVETYDFDLVHSFMTGPRNEVVWGGGFRQFDYRIHSSGGLQWEPTARNLSLYNLFVQDTVALGPRASLIAGVKVEDDPYVHAEVLPNLRLSLKPNPKLSLWASASRAIRSPTPFDRDVVEVLGGVRFLVGGRNFVSEKLTAYEVGAKAQPSPNSSISISGYYNDYDKLRSIEPDPVSGFIPLYWGNMIEGHTYGVEAWGEYQAAAWWRLSGGASYLQEKFGFRPGASRLLGVSQVANDPTWQGQVRSSMSLPHRVELDATLRYVGEMPNPRVAAYTELNARLAWALTDKAQIALVGRNLLHEDHIEYTQGSAIPRSVYVDLQWRF
jgi:iron complex outermembrane receptor protein